MKLVVPQDARPVDVIERLNQHTPKYLYEQNVRDLVRSLYPGVWDGRVIYVTIKSRVFYLDDKHCAICLDEGETWTRLACGHEFHHTCIHRWHSVKHNCPLCRS